MDLRYIPFSVPVGEAQPPLSHGLISGVAGSGKTLLAQHIAQKFVSSFNQCASDSGARVIVGTSSTTDNWNDDCTLYEGLNNSGDSSLDSFMVGIEKLVHNRLGFVRRGADLGIDLDETVPLLPPVLVIVDGVDWRVPEGKQNLKRIVSMVRISRHAGVFFLFTAQSLVGLSGLINQMSYSISLDENSAKNTGKPYAGNQEPGQK